MVECTGFENRQARKGLGSSNLPLSATAVFAEYTSAKTGVERGGDSKDGGGIQDFERSEKCLSPSRGRENFSKKNYS